MQKKQICVLNMVDLCTISGAKRERKHKKVTHNYNMFHAFSPIEHIKNVVADDNILTCFLAAATPPNSLTFRCNEPKHPRLVLRWNTTSLHWERVHSSGYQSCRLRLQQPMVQDEREPLQRVTVGDQNKVTAANWEVVTVTNRRLFGCECCIFYNHI